MAGQGRYEPIFQDEEEAVEAPEPALRKGVDAKNQAGRGGLGEEDEEVWDRLG